jgi:hypothetical protein
LDKNDIEITYKRGEGTGRCDKFIVKDHGVGIGLRRLQGVLEVGYSTKRCRKDALGAFGLGAKVGLSTGSDYYTMITVHNGIKYHVKIFSMKVNSLIGALNLETEEENVPYIFYDDDGNETGRIHGERTDEKNYTQIEVPCLKHYKEDFDRGVKTQLLFFDNVRYFNEDSDGHSREVQFRANVLHNSDNIIIAEDTPYSKPFVVIVNGNQAVGVCYGHIDFKELELQDMHGGVGIKCNIRQARENPETGETEVINPGVDVIASREGIRWTPSTREYLLNKFESAKEEATKLVEGELKVDDFLQWLTACKSITSHGSSNTALGKLSNIVDLNTLRPSFKNTGIKFSFTIEAFFKDFQIRVASKYQDKDDKNLFKCKRSEILNTTGVDYNNLYIVNEGVNSSRLKDVYLADQNNGSFFTIKANSPKAIQSDIRKQKGKICS